MSVSGVSSVPSSQVTKLQQVTNVQAAEPAKSSRPTAAEFMKSVVQAAPPPGQGRLVDKRV